MLEQKKETEFSVLLSVSSEDTSLAVVSVAAQKNMKCYFQINHSTSAGNLSKENRRGFYSSHSE